MKKILHIDGDLQQKNKIFKDSSNNIKQITDKAQNISFFTNGTYITYVYNNGKPYLQFNGTDARLLSNNTSEIFNIPNFTLRMVFNVRTGGTTDQIYLNQYNGVDYNFKLSYGGQNDGRFRIYWRDSNDTNYTLTTTSFYSSGSPFVEIYFIKKDLNLYLVVNGKLERITSISSNGIGSFLSDLEIGGYGGEIPSTNSGIYSLEIWDYDVLNIDSYALNTQIFNIDESDYYPFIYKKKYTDSTYLGEQFIDNSDFETDTSGWGGDTENYGWSSKYGGSLKFDRVDNGFARAVYDTTNVVEVGEDYEYIIDIKENPNNVGVHYYNGQEYVHITNGVGLFKIRYTRVGTTNLYTYVRILGDVGDVVYIGKVEQRKVYKDHKILYITSRYLENANINSNDEIIRINSEIGSSMGYKNTNSPNLDNGIKTQGTRVLPIGNLISNTIYPITNFTPYNNDATMCWWMKLDRNNITTVYDYIVRLDKGTSGASNRTLSIRQTVNDISTTYHIYDLNISGSIILKCSFSLPTELVENTWIHFGVVYKDTTMYIFVNGILKSTCIKDFVGDDEHFMWLKGYEGLNFIEYFDDILLSNTAEIDPTDYEIDQIVFKKPIRGSLETPEPTYNGGKYSPEFINEMIYDKGYIPIANVDDIGNLGIDTTQTMGGGTGYENTYTTGLDKKYVVVKPISGNVPNAAYSNFTGTFDGNNHLLKLDGGLFGDKTSGKLLNIRLSPTITTAGISSGNDGWGSLARSVSGATITDCSVIDIDITFTAGNGNYAGMIGGIFNSNISNCYGENIKLNSTDTAYAQYGTLFGNADVDTLIEDCYSKGQLLFGGTHTGGLIGRNYGTMKNCFADVEINCTNSVRFGGFVGANHGEIRECAAYGDVSGTTHVGGFVGYMFSGLIIDSYCYGNVYASDNNTIGGFAGRITNGSIETSYSSGYVYTNSGTTLFGGFIGRGNIGTDCYYDSDVSGQSDTDGATPKTTVQMMQEATFTNWNFNGTWKIDEGNRYPYQWFKKEVQEIR